MALLGPAVHDDTRPQNLWLPPCTDLCTSGPGKQTSSVLLRGFPSCYSGISLSLKASSWHWKAKKRSSTMTCNDSSVQGADVNSQSSWEESCKMSFPHLHALPCCLLHSTSVSSWVALTPACLLLCSETVKKAHRKAPKTQQYKTCYFMFPNLGIKASCSTANVLANCNFHIP